MHAKALLSFTAERNMEHYFGSGQSVPFISWYHLFDLTHHQTRSIWCLMFADMPVTTFARPSAATALTNKDGLVNLEIDTQQFVTFQCNYILKFHEKKFNIYDIIFPWIITGVWEDPFHSGRYTQYMYSLFINGNRRQQKLFLPYKNHRVYFDPFHNGRYSKGAISN